MLRKSDYTDDDWRCIKSMKASLSMTIQRCRNPNCRDYRYYGGRGIQICDRWLVFENFLSDMGIRPDGLTLDRIDVNGDYTPENCRWATRAQQSANMRRTKLIRWAGLEMTVSAWEHHLGWKPGVLKARLNRLGYSIDDAFTKEVKCGGLLPGRVYKQRRKPDTSHLQRGLDHETTRLGYPSVILCRYRHKRLNEPISRLAAEYKVSQKTMKNAIEGLGAYKETRDDQ